MGLVWLALAPSAALAHASLVASDPANEAVLTTAPATLTLRFNEAVEPLALRLIDARGTATPIVQIDRDGDNLVLTPPAPLGEGVHLLSWRVISEDGHPVGGSLSFSIGRADTALPTLEVTGHAPRRAAIWLARLAIYLGLFVGAGGAFFLAWVPRSQPDRGTTIGCAVISLVGLAAVAVSTALQGLDMADLPLRRLLSTAAWASGMQGSFGHAAAIAVVALLCGLVSLASRGRAAKTWSLIALLGTGAALAASGHAATANPRWVTMTSVFVHGVCLAYWIGALLPLGLALRAGADRGRDSLAAFSRTIPFAVGALLASGVALAVVQLGRVAALWTTSYGQVLCVKIALVLLLLAFALLNRRLTPGALAGAERPRRALRRSIAAELIVVAAILGVVALWRFTPPPRALAAATDSSVTYLHAERAMAQVTVAPGRAGPIDITVELEAPDHTPLRAQALTVTLSNPAMGIEPAAADAQSLGSGQWRVRMVAPVPGRWTLSLGILISDFNKIVVEGPILIR
ncbi:copper resistance protein [Rhodopseudomonas palustris]|uniref:Copper resistance protein n=1 Tax=Rhodopseudomonas palustris TaxID=1076 RepID=A0A0D7E9C8_RHOPL|nr:copper resistance protein [Rhodopseudomonas palustris]